MLLSLFNKLKIRSKKLMIKLKLSWAKIHLPLLLSQKKRKSNQLKHPRKLRDKKCKSRKNLSQKDKKWMLNDKCKWKIPYLCIYICKMYNKTKKSSLESKTQFLLPLLALLLLLKSPIYSINFSFSMLCILINLCISLELN